MHVKHFAKKMVDLSFPHNHSPEARRCLPLAGPHSACPGPDSAPVIPPGDLLDVLGNPASLSLPFRLGSDLGEICRRRPQEGPELLLVFALHVRLLRADPMGFKMTHDG